MSDASSIDGNGHFFFHLMNHLKYDLIRRNWRIMRQADRIFLTDILRSPASNKAWTCSILSAVAVMIIFSYHYYTKKIGFIGLNSILLRFVTIL